MSNEDCLAGMRCPKCGAVEPLHIETVTKATVAMHRDGFDPHALADGDTTWSGESACRCPCGFADKVAAFRLPKEDKPPTRVPDVQTAWDDKDPTVLHVHSALKLFGPLDEADAALSPALPWPEVEKESGSQEPTPPHAQPKRKIRPTAVPVKVTYRPGKKEDEE